MEKSVEDTGANFPPSAKTISIALMNSAFAIDPVPDTSRGANKLAHSAFALVQIALSDFCGSPLAASNAATFLAGRTSTAFGDLDVPVDTFDAHRFSAVSITVQCLLSATFEDGAPTFNVSTGDTVAASAAPGEAVCVVADGKAVDVFGGCASDLDPTFGTGSNFCANR